jgi:hypothetical protein
MGNAPVHGFAGVWPESKKNQSGLIFSVIRQAVEQLMQLREIYIDVRLDTLGDLQRQVIVVNTDYNVTGSMAMRLMAGDSDESVKDDITTVSRWIAQRVIELVLVNEHVESEENIDLLMSVPTSEVTRVVSRMYLLGDLAKISTSDEDEDMDNDSDIEV